MKSPIIAISCSPLKLLELDLNMMWSGRHGGNCVVGGIVYPVYLISSLLHLLCVLFPTFQTSV